MRGIKKIEHITTYPAFRDNEYNVIHKIIDESYIITYAEGQIMVSHNFSELPKKAKKFFCRKYKYPHLYNQEFIFGIKYTAKINTYTFKDPI